MLVFFSPVFVLALSGEVLFWIFSFVTNKNQIYSDAEHRSGRRSDVLEMKAQLMTHDSAGITVRLAWLPMPPLTELQTEIQFSYRRTQQTLAGGQYSPLFLYGFVTYFCMAHETGTVFTLLNGWNKTKRRTIFGDMRKLHEIHISVPTNKVLLGYSHSHLFVYHPWPCSHCNCRVQWTHRCERGQVALRAWNIYSLVLPRKSLSTSTLSLEKRKIQTVIPPPEDSSWGLNKVLVVKNPPANAGDTGDMGLILGLGRSPGGGNAIRSSILAWNIPRAEEPGRLPSMGSQRVRHDWATEHAHRDKI